MAAAIPWPLISSVIAATGLLNALVNTGFGITRTLPSHEDYYSVRLEAGIGAGSDGHAPKIHLTDYQGQTFKGYIEGHAGQTCSEVVKRYHGLGIGEAPRMFVHTVNGFNLKKMNIMPGGNGVCLSNVVLKAGQSAARQDEIFIPVGDILSFCGYAWNWGASQNGVDQRCVWVGDTHPYRTPDGDQYNNIGILDMNMARMQGIFDARTYHRAKTQTTFDNLCQMFKDSSKGYNAERNTHHCRDSKPEESSKSKSLSPSAKDLTEDPRAADTIPLIGITVSDFREQLRKNPHFVGGPFMTQDGYVYLPSEKRFIRPRSSAALNRRSFRKRDTDTEMVVRVQKCSRNEETDELVCTVVNEVLLPTNGTYVR
ncbi:hypothetical protein HK102_001956 [Quaeritorhiza haematococci]|nr:hypothetical protein HK102_001956 [Quaeritorhiza haematococci]